MTKRIISFAIFVVFAMNLDRNRKLQMSNRKSRVAMDKKHHQRRQKGLNREELSDMTHPGASFSTEAGRAAQGMRRDLGGKATPPMADSGEDRRDKEQTLNDER